MPCADWISENKGTNVPGVFGLIQTAGQPISSELETIFEQQDGLEHRTAKSASCYIGATFHTGKELTCHIAETDHYIVLVDGYLFNTEIESIPALYEKYGDCYCAHIDGYFTCVLLDKRQNKLTISSDHLRTKNIFYFHDDERGITAFNYRLAPLTEIVKRLGVGPTADEDALASMLSLTYVLGDRTLISEAKRLEPGTVLICNLESGSVSTERYWRFRKERLENVSYDEAIEEFYRLFSLSNARCFEIGREAGYTRHLALLSGGLDSRIGLLQAIEDGYTETESLTFGTSSSDDVRIAGDVAAGNGITHHMYPLDGGAYLKGRIEELCELTQGLSSMLGISHLYSALAEVGIADFCVLHTGQIGDLVFGSYTKSAFRFLDIAYNDIARSTSTYNRQLIHEYSDPELFTLAQKLPNAIINSDNAISELIQPVSPFYSKELIEFSLSLPDIYKKDQKAQIDMIVRYLPSANRHVWEKTGCLPSQRLLGKVKGKMKWFIEGASNRLGISSGAMNPFKYWYRTDETLKRDLDSVLGTIDDLPLDAEITTYLQQQAKSQNVRLKYNAANISVNLAALLS